LGAITVPSISMIREISFTIRPTPLLEAQVVYRTRQEYSQLVGLQTRPRSRTRRCFQDPLAWVETIEKMSRASDCDFHQINRWKFAI
jgi:hypothetical protein